MKALGTLLGVVALVFATLPGIATLLDALEAPPDSQQLFGAFLLAFGVMTLLLMVLWRDRIQRADRRYVLGGVLLCVMLALTAFSLHDEVFRKTVVRELVARDSTSQIFDTVTVFYPISLSGDLKEWVGQAGGRRDVFEYHSVEEVATEAARYSKASTVTLLLLLRMGTVLPLIAAFAIAGWSALGRGEFDETDRTSNSASSVPHKPASDSSG